MITKHSKRSVTQGKHSVGSQEKMVVANTADKPSWASWQGSLQTRHAVGDQQKGPEPCLDDRTPAINLP